MFKGLTQNPNQLKDRVLSTDTGQFGLGAQSLPGQVDMNRNVSVGTVMNIAAPMRQNTDQTLEDSRFDIN